MAETKIMKCTCESKFQDSRYGKGNRVHNQTQNRSGRGNWRCTVCEKEK